MQYLVVLVAAVLNLHFYFSAPTATTVFPFGNPADLFEGDIKLTEVQEKAVKKAIKNEKDGVSTFGLTNVYPPWKNGIVVYSIHRSIGQRQSSAIFAAMKEWTTKTSGCITFKRRTTERNYLEFYVGNGCWGHIGQPNGKSQISVGRGCEQRHVMSHEIGHSLGFWHEQSRTDRDKYIQILWSNVPASLREAFAKYGRDKIDSLGVPYDYTSIMHYPWNAFSTNGRNTVKALRRVPSPGPYVRISDLDVKQTKLFYKCSGGKPITTKRPPATKQPPITKLTERPPITECVTVEEKGVTEKTSCVDKSRFCSSWARRGECKKNPNYMEPNCCRSCGGSSTGCVDSNRHCSSWARSGYCRSNPGYMDVSCKRSCRKCPTTKKKKCRVVTTPSPTKTIPPPPIDV